MWFTFAVIALLCWSGSDLFSKIGCQSETDKYSHLKMVTAVGVVMGLHACYEIFIGGVEISWSVILTYLVPKAIEEAVDKAGLTIEDIDLFVIHQANIRIIEAVSKRLKVPMEKFPTNLENCGNISAGSVPVLLDQVNRSGKIRQGDKIVLAGFGAGLTWGASVLTW